MFQFFGQALSPIVNALHGLLDFFYGYTHDLALSIVLMTVVVKLFLHPLTRVQLRSMKAMQVLGPHIKALQQKHKNDRQGLQTATMALYRAHNVNPFGGCLPILVQMPILFGLTRLLFYTKNLFANATLFGIPSLQAGRGPESDARSIHCASADGGGADLPAPRRADHVVPATADHHGSEPGPDVDSHADHDRLLRDAVPRRAFDLLDRQHGAVHWGILSRRRAPQSDGERAAEVSGAGRGRRAARAAGDAAAVAAGVRGTRSPSPAGACGRGPSPAGRRERSAREVSGRRGPHRRRGDPRRAARPRREAGRRRSHGARRGEPRGAGARISRGARPPDAPVGRGRAGGRRGRTRDRGRDRRRSARDGAKRDLRADRRDGLSRRHQRARGRRRGAGDDHRRKPCAPDRPARPDPGGARPARQHDRLAAGRAARARWSSTRSGTANGGERP